MFLSLSQSGVVLTAVLGAAGSYVAVEWVCSIFMLRVIIIRDVRKTRSIQGQKSNLGQIFGPI